MNPAVIIIMLVVVCFGGVLMFGAPYLPTLKPQVETALELAKLKKGQTLIELGSGDGRVMIAAAKRGINVVGYELNPILVAISWLRTRRYRKQVTIVWGDFWTRDWPKANAIFTFLLPKYMAKLDSKIKTSNNKRVKLVSFAFKVPNKKIKKSDKGVYLYHYGNVR